LILYNPTTEQVGKNVVYCILSVPLLYGGNVMGVMTLTNKVKHVDDKLELDLLGRFGDDDAQLLLGLADQAAVNLHKAKLYSASITDRLTGLFNARHFEQSFEAFVEEAHESRTQVSLAVTVSAGVACFPEAADKAFYASKSAGRNRVTRAFRDRLLPFSA
jgi:hypothetical protein